jgi:hypothetical protein
MAITAGKYMIRPSITIPMQLTQITQTLIRNNTSGRMNLQTRRSGPLIIATITLTDTTMIAGTISRTHILTTQNEDSKNKK